MAVAGHGYDVIGRVPLLDRPRSPVELEGHMMLIGRFDQTASRKSGDFFLQIPRVALIIIYFVLLTFRSVLLMSTLRAEHFST